jgi:hypothetical protein
MNKQIHKTNIVYGDDAIPSTHTRTCAHKTNGVVKLLRKGCQLFRP